MKSKILNHENKIIENVRSGLNLFSFFIKYENNLVDIIQAIVQIDTMIS